nr:hypothetical protein [uncultured Albidiferax sp.]
MKISDRKAKLANLQAQRASIDMNPMRAQFDQAKADRAAYQVTHASSRILPDESALLIAESTAANALRAAEDKVRELDIAIQPLQAMISAPARVATAKVEVIALANRAGEAGKVVACKQETVLNLQSLLADASATHELNHASAAQEVLAAAKAGRSVKVAPADRGAVNLLESALTLATAELAESQAAHALAVQAHADGNQVLKFAERDAARLAWDLFMHDIAQKLVAYRAMGHPHYKPGLDLMELVHALEAEPRAAAA